MQTLCQHKYVNLILTQAEQPGQVLVDKQHANIPANLER